MRSPKATPRRVQRSPLNCWRKRSFLLSVGCTCDGNTWEGQGDSLRHVEHDNFVVESGTCKRQCRNCGGKTRLADGHGLNNSPDGKHCYATCSHRLSITFSVDRDLLGECTRLRLQCVDREKGDA